MQLYRGLIKAYRENKWDRRYHPVASLYGYATIGSVAYAVIYFFMKIYILSAILLLTYFLFLWIAFLFSKNKRRSALFLTFVNLTVMVIASMWFLGIDSGGHYFLLCGIVLFFTTDSLKKICRYIISALCLAEYITLEILFHSAVPIAQVSDSFLVFINHINILIAFGAITYTTVAYRFSVDEYETELKELNDKNEHMANFDYLTNLPNRRMLYTQLDEFIKGASESGKSFVVGIMDIDNFKDLNDQYGHVCGDEALGKIAKVLKCSVRENDIVGRWGGEEFLIILPKTALEDGFHIMERVRKAVSGIQLECTVDNYTVTATIGCTEYKPNHDRSELLRDADKLLYLGKNTGKNVVITN